MDFKVQIKDVVGKTPKILDASNIEIQTDEIKTGSSAQKRRGVFRRYS
jgi:hypothetical protein